MSDSYPVSATHMRRVNGRQFAAAQRKYMNVWETRGNSAEIVPNLTCVQCVFAWKMNTRSLTVVSPLSLDGAYPTRARRCPLVTHRKNDNKRFVIMFGSALIGQVSVEMWSKNKILFSVLMVVKATYCYSIYKAMPFDSHRQSALNATPVTRVNSL